MSWLFKVLWLLFGDEAKRHALKSVKRRGVLAYLRALQVGRRIFLVAILCVVFIQLMVFAGVGALVTGIFLWNEDFQFKMEILFWICAGLFLIPTVLLTILMSERLWYKLSGAQKMLNGQ